MPGKRRRARVRARSSVRPGTSPEGLVGTCFLEVRNDGVDLQVFYDQGRNPLVVMMAAAAALDAALSDELDQAAVDGDASS